MGCKRHDAKRDCPVRHGETCYLARTKEEWSKALLDAVSHAENRERIGSAARREIVPQFTASVTAQQLSDFLDELKDAP
jgi:glycosyltransferase involved in cell wall biosynthesis